MPTSLLEIVDLGDGEIVLQRADDREDGDTGELTGEPTGRGEPLVTIRFSEESRLYILDQSLEVAKAMIQAGIQAAAMLAEQAEVDVETDASQNEARVLH